MKCSCIPCMLQTIEDDKLPKGKSSYVGVEVEFISKTNYDEMAYRMLNAKLGKYIQIKSDGSIRTMREYGNNFEIAILCPTRSFEKIIKKVCKVIIDADSRVNRSCGLHIHLDMRHNLNYKRIYHNLYVAQPLLYAIQPKSRRNNDYCSQITSGRFPENGYGGRPGINGSAYYEHKTIEVRLHAGTINSTKIINWIRILQCIVNKKTLINEQVTTLSKFTEVFNLSTNLQRYIRDRLEQFADGKKEIDEVA